MQISSKCSCCIKNGMTEMHCTSPTLQLSRDDCNGLVNLISVAVKLDLLRSVISCSREKLASLWSNSMLL